MIATKYLTDLKKVYYNSSNADRFFYNNSEAMRMIYNGEIVFDRQQYYIEAPSYVDQHPSAIPDLKSFIGTNYSYKKAFDGTKTNVDYSITPTKIEANESTEQKKITQFTMIQEGSGLEVTGTYSQIADYFSHYVYRNVAITSVQYPTITASGTGVNGVTPIAYYSGKKYAVYASGREEHVDNLGGQTSNFTDITCRLTSAGSAIGATIGPDTGIVTAPNLGDEAYPEQAVARITYVEIYVDGVGYLDWSGTADAIQMKNELRTSYSDYQISSSLDVPNESTIEGEAIDLHVTVSAYLYEEFVWSSGADGGYDNTPVTVWLDVNDGDLAYSSASGDDSITWSIGRNTETYTKTLTCTVSNTSANYNKTHTVYQSPYEEPEYWGPLSLNGSIIVEDVLANGDGQPILVPVIQYKYKGSSIIDTWSTSVSAIAISGTPVSGTGAVFSNGVISCNSMGSTPYTNGRDIYTLKKVTVYDVLGDEKTLSLSSYVTIRQEPNILEKIYVNSLVDIATYSHSTSTVISSSGATITFLVYANDYYKEEWTSGSPGSSGMEGASGSLKTSLSGGKLSSSSFSTDENGKSYTLTVPANTGSQRTFTITATTTSAFTKSDSLTYTQAAAHVESWAIPTLNGSISVGTIPAKGGSVTVSVPIKQVKSDENGSIPYTDTVTATALSGTAYNGGSVSGGTISAGSRGTTRGGAWTVYTITSVTVNGFDGRSYTLSLPSAVNVTQSRNYNWYVEDSRTVELYASPTTVGFVGGSATITFGGKQYGHILYDSGDTTAATGTGNMSLRLSTTHGTLSKTTGSGLNNTATLTIPADYETTSDKTITVSMTASPYWGDSSSTRTCTITQEGYQKLPTATFTGTFKFGPSLSGGNNYNVINVSNAAMSAVNTSAYKGGTMTNLTFKVVNTSTGVVYDTKEFGDVYVAKGSSTSISLSYLTNSSGLSNVHVEVWYDGELQQTYSIMSNSTGQ